ncbi:MAG: D-alanyl-D-alanine carboxypeptidase/D-alanyl-D-alanine-endopeptidase [Candidatus Delongbacteria bacterium]|nr:D-alanyl-D-alanine carboxypeptidase/D-alanyl-D-alanine-endopeptidase [Candidatus Delongbacteria bacterium]MCG2759885.1 D-alanyl-D-alanine carboxypeptidase/D-alanyl-D-alanine-endopeptidase [Candidatus Delongbacteria bacterium]
MLKLLNILLAAFFLISCSGSKELGKSEPIRKVKVTDIDISNLPKELTVLSDPRSGVWSVSFYDLDSKETIFEYNKNKNLLPASNLKMVTIAAALKILGPEYRFATEFFINGYIDRKLNLLKGNLLIKGTGDPTIGRDFFKTGTLNEFQPLIDSLRKSKGIDFIEGDLIVLTPFKQEEAYGKSWDIDDISSYYSAPISPLTLNENLTKIIINKGKVDIVPPYPFKIKLDTVPNLDKPEFNRLAGSDSLIIRSDFKKSISGFVTVHNPDLFFKRNLKDYMARNKVIFMNKTVTVTDTAKYPVFTLYSDSLYKIINKCNSESNNLYAEQIFRKIAEVLSKDTTLTDSLENLKPDYNNLIKVNEDIYKRMFGIDNFSVCDGSGLSRRDFFSADKFIKVLATMYDDEYFLPYISSFPQPGMEGTLISKMTHIDLQNRLFAKTGSMSGVNNISGYLLTKKNHRLAFSIMNNYYDFGRSRTNDIYEDILVYFVNNF